MTDYTQSLRTDLLLPAHLIDLGRDEMNLAELPIAVLGTSRPKKGEEKSPPKTIHFDHHPGRLTITASDEYGLPNAGDTDLILALMYITKRRNDFTSVKVNFSRYELISLLNLPHDGASYDRVDRAFNRWTGVLLVYDKCWWNNKLKCYTSAKMHIIDNVEILDNDARRKAQHLGQGGLPLSTFTWDEKFIESCRANNLRQLNLEEYFSLKHAVSKRLYRFLGKRFYKQSDWTFDLREIAFERVGLTRSYADAGKIKEKLQPAIDELEQIGFLQPLSRDDRYSRVDRGHWTIRLMRQSPPLDVPQQAEQEPPPSPLIGELVKRGVSEKTAKELVAQYPAEHIEKKIEHFDWEMAQPKPPKRPAGYLVKSIPDNYTPDPKFVPKAERDRKAEAKRQADQQAAADRRQKHEEEARQQERRREADAYWSKLSPTDQAELEAKALAAASEETRNTYLSLKRKGMGDGLLAGLRREYIMTLIDAEKAAEPA